MRALEQNELAQVLVLRRHWLPGAGDTAEHLAEAIWLEQRYQENLRVAVASGIALALKGE